jgi:hypothetical protein
LTLKNNL